MVQRDCRSKLPVPLTQLGAVDGQRAVRGKCSRRGADRDLPTGWQDLPPEQFVAMARNVMESGAPDERDVLAIRQHVAQLVP